MLLLCQEQLLGVRLCLDSREEEERTKTASNSGRKSSRMSVSSPHTMCTVPMPNALEPLPRKRSVLVHSGRRLQGGRREVGHKVAVRCRAQQDILK